MNRDNEQRVSVDQVTPGYYWCRPQGADWFMLTVSRPESLQYGLSGAEFIRIEKPAHDG